MIIRDIVTVLDANIVYGNEYLDRKVHSACGADMMSDVLAYVKDQSVLLTGLCNTQVIRTAEMMDMICIVFVRGKQPDQTMKEMASARKIVLLTTNHRMFSACGLLYKNGLRGGAAD